MKTFFQSFSVNWGAGLTVALISFPLSLALAVAAGAPPIVGLITGAWAGLLGAFLTGTPLVIVGVAASIITLQSGFTGMYPEAYGFALAALTITVGLILLIVRALSLHEFIKFVPASLVTGFAAGVGIIICLTQASSILGFSLLPLGDITQFDPYAFGLFVITMTLILGSEKLLPKVPSAIVISVPALIAGWAFSRIEAPIRLLNQQYPDLSAQLVHFPSWNPEIISPEFFGALVSTAVMISVIIVLESLITSRFVQKEAGVSGNNGKEILGMGIVNVVLGFLGGMPVLGLISRTSANLQTGAKDRMAVALYGIFMGIMMIALIQIVGFYPFPVIAAILVRVALPLVNVSAFKHLYVTDRIAFGITVLVALLVVFSNASIAILIGATLHLVVLIRRLALSEFRLTLKESGTTIFDFTGMVLPKVELPAADSASYYMEGLVSYFNIDKHLCRIRLIQAQEIELNLDYLFSIDFESSDLLEELVEELEMRGVTVLVTNPHRNVRRVFIDNPSITRLMEKVS